MNAFLHHFSYDFKSGIRNRMMLFINYLFPLGFYAIMGLVMTAINPAFKGVLIPAMVLFTIMASTLLGLPNPIVESRLAGIYRSFKINGVPAVSIITIPIVTTVVHALIASTLVALTAAPFFDGLPPNNWLNYFLISLLAAFTCGSLGALIGVISKDTRAVTLWSQMIFLTSMLIGGLMVPIDILPEFIRPFSLLMPTTQAMQAYNGLAYGAATLFDPWLAVLVLLATGLLAFLLAIFLFSWDSENSTRRGSPLLALLVLVPALVSIFLL